MARFFQLAMDTTSRLSHAFNTDNRRQFERDAVFLVFLGFSLFLLLALVCFQPFENWLYSSAQITQRSHNLAGPSGNSMAGVLLFYMGLSAFTLPALVIQIGGQLRSANLKQTLIPIVAGWLTLLMSLMPLLASLQPTLPIRGVGLASGGAIGSAFLHSLKGSAGPVGTHIILWTALAASLILISRSEISDLFRFWPLHSKRKKGASDTSQDSASANKISAGSDVDALPSSILDHAQSALTNWAVTARDAASATAETLIPSESPTESSNFHDLHVDPDDSMPALSNGGGDVVTAASLDDFAPQRPYITPSLDTFRRADERNTPTLSQKELEATGAVLTKTLSEFGIEGRIVGWQPGPVVTVYEYQPDAGIKQSKILSLMDDLALSLKVDSIFINPVPGKRALGIQVPNQRRETVYLGDILSSDQFQKSPSPMTFAMGKTINGQPFTADLTTMPHLLAAGATGTGKSVGINSLLCSVIMKSSPEDVRMILVDPKMLELSVYDGIPHLLMPVITEPDRASSALKWAANEMERRYKIMQHAQVRNIAGFNAFWENASDARKEQIRGLMNDSHITRLPYILLVIDELADLMLTAPKDVESSIQRLAQKARASGIHMVLATQRPSVDVITGVIKANLPCRLSFQVVSKHDSRTILDQMGAEKLLGRGDLLLQRPGVGRLERLQGALVSDEEVLALVAETKRNYDVVYDERAMTWIDQEVTRNTGIDDLNDGAGASAANDPKWEDAINIARTHGVVSASFLQRHLQIGYNRAARIVEGMEAKNLVAKAEGSKPRKWLGGI